MKPYHLALGFGALGGILLFAFFPISPASYQQAAIASAATTPSVSFSQSTFQTKEGTSAVVRVKLDQPVERTTRVCIRFTPDAGTTSRDFVNPGCATVTFYKGGLTQKSVLLKTVNTTTTANESVTARIDTINGVKVSTPSAPTASTARIVITDKTSKPSDTGGTVLTGPNGTGTTRPPVVTPPVDCSLYSGVLPGPDKAKVGVQMRSFATWTMPGVDLEGLAKISQDLAGQKMFDAAGTLGRRRTFAPGSAYAYKFTTNDYNVPTVYQDMTMTDHPGGNGGRMLVSVSLCPGDFTSPAVLAQQAGYDANGLSVGYGGRDNHFPLCVSSASMTGGGMTFGVGVGEFSCNLEKNKTYYLNFTGGFVKASDSSGGPYTASFSDGTYGGNGGASHSFDVEFKLRPDSLGFFGYRTSTGGASQPVVKVMKSVDATYEAVHRAFSAWNQQAYAAGQTNVARIQACLASGAPRSQCNFTITTPATPGSWQ